MPREGNDESPSRVILALGSRHNPVTDEILRGSDMVKLSTFLASTFFLAIAFTGVTCAKRYCLCHS